MNVSAQEFDRFTCRLIAWLTHAQPMDDVEAAEAFLRTQLHPDLYANAQRLQQIMHDEGARFVRRVAQRVGTQDIQRLFPDASGYLHAYEHGNSDAKLLAQCFRELSILAAIVDQPFLERLSTAVILNKTVNDVLRRFQQHDNGHAASRDFWETYQQLKRAEGEAPTQHRELVSHPVVVRLRDDNPYLLETQVRMVDPVRHHYHVTLQNPVQLQQWNVDRTLTVPWDRVRTHGLTIDIAFERGYELYTNPIRCHVTVAELEAVRDRGSAVAAFIGRNGEIRLFQEDIDVFPGEPHPIPSAHVASIRVTPTLVEINRLHPGTRLTVFA